MPLDELTDDQLDHQLRELLPPAPRARSWERTQRELLISYITTGETDRSHATAPDGELFELTGPRADRSRPRGSWILAGAAAILIVGLIVVQRPADPAAPAQQPIESSPEVAALPAAPLGPDRFGVVTDAWPTDAATSAAWGGQLGWDNATVAEALVARRDGEFLRDAITLAVRSDGAGEEIWGRPPQAATVAGVDVEIYFDPGSPEIETVVLPGSPEVQVTGRDPVAFLEAAGGVPVAGERIDADGEVTFAIGDLPDGFELIVAPTRLPLGSIEAFTNAPDGDGGDGISIWMTVRNPLIAHAPYGDLQEIDVNGTSGWLHDRGPGSSVIWQVSDTTWASIGGASTVDDAIAFARSIDFVDEATWTERYDVERGNYTTREQMVEMSTTPVSTLPEPTTLVVSRSEVASLPSEAPVACGDRPPTDEPLADAPSAPSPDDALAAFLGTDRARTLYKLGFEQFTVAGTHRYERRNETGDLVTIVDVTQTDGGWRATRLQASPC